MPRDLSDALRWISNLLTDLGVPHQFVGGLAAACYGSTRPLVDIDLYVPDEKALDQLALASGPHLVRPPMRYRDQHWQLTFLKLQRGEFQIEAAAAARNGKLTGRPDIVWTASR